ncbi:PfkB family carbohydrate kinase [Streptomyces sp. NPDC098077]|uniref:PfkB family carbohydrate kinase n=1 Tax=Streptomyces sp. NPDC098077 TaxID=3366093 RepID=UPI003805642D
MRIAVTGSIATDHLMVVPGRSTDQLIPDRLAALLLERTGWTREGVLPRAGARVTTLGGEGVRIERVAEPTLTVPAVPAVPGVPVADPAGGGDAFRAGFPGGVARGRAAVPAARPGGVLAAQALEGAA